MAYKYRQQILRLHKNLFSQLEKQMKKKKKDTDQLVGEVDCMVRMLLDGDGLHTTAIMKGVDSRKIKDYIYGDNIEWLFDFNDLEPNP